MSTYSKWLLTILSVVAVLSGATYFHRYRKDHCKERLKAQASEFAIMNEGRSERVMVISPRVRPWIPISNHSGWLLGLS